MTGALVTSLVLGNCTVTGDVAPPQARDTEADAVHELTGALHARTGAYLIVRDAVSRLRVRFADLPGLLYRITTPAGSGLAPQVTGPAGRVLLNLRPTGGDGPDEVTIVLNGAARWDIRLPAGGGEQDLNLAGGRITRLDLGTGGLLDVRLPRPAGTVPVTLTGGAGSVRIVAPRTTPVRLRLRAGAGTLVTPWGAPPSGGTVVASPGWAGAAHRYAIDARADVAALTLR